MNLSSTNNAVLSQLPSKFGFNVVNKDENDLSSNTASLNGGEVTISVIPPKRIHPNLGQRSSTSVKNVSMEANLKEAFQSISPLWHSLATNSASGVNDYLSLPLVPGGAGLPFALREFFEKSLRQMEAPNDAANSTAIGGTPKQTQTEQISQIQGVERRFFCDICGAGLKRKDHLTRHKQSHNPDRPHVCSVCTKAFKRKEQLALHYVIHSGEKRHVCEECGKGFYRKDHLRKHIRSHVTRRVKAAASNFLAEEENKYMANEYSESCSS